jgi:hypothetical protein
VELLRPAVTVPRRCWRSSPTRSAPTRPGAHVFASSNEGGIWPVIKFHVTDERGENPMGRNIIRFPQEPVMAMTFSGRKVGMSQSERSGYEPTMKERIERLRDANEVAKLVEALRVATNALAWYADEKHWREDDWGCVAVIDPPDYGQGGKKARNAIKRIERLLRPARIAKLLRDLGDDRA